MNIHDEQPLVSVVIPAYNRAGTIEATVQSVQAQTYSQWEIIISDDGSKDNTIEVIKKLMGHDNRVKLITCNTNGVCTPRLCR